MLFAGNLTKQPAYINQPYRVIEKLDKTDLFMNYALWIGVYPGLKKSMLEYIDNTFEKFFKKF